MSGAAQTGRRGCGLVLLAVTVPLLLLLLLLAALTSIASLLWVLLIIAACRARRCGRGAAAPLAAGTHDRRHPVSSGIDADIALDAAVVLSLGMNRLLGRAGARPGGARRPRRTRRRAGRGAGGGARRGRVPERRALREVVERNARIAALAETRAKIGAEVPLPERLTAQEQTPRS